MDLKTAIKKRKSVRRYMDKKPNWRKIIRAVDAARFAPSAGGQFVMRFILVTDEKAINELAKAAQQNYIGTAKAVVVAVSDDTQLVRRYGERGSRYASQQAGAALQNFLLALTEQGLVSSWVGHFYEQEVREALNIPEGLTVEALFPIGKETKVKGRERRAKPDLENVLYFEKWKNKKMNPPKTLSVGAV